MDQLAQARAWLAEINPALPYLLTAGLVWVLVYLWRRFHLKSFDALPSGAQALPGLIAAGVLTAMSTQGPILDVIFSTIVGAVTGGLTASGGHHALKAIKAIPYGSAGVLVVAFTLPGCAAWSSAKPIVRDIRDVARAECAAHFSAKQGISLEDAFESFCDAEDTLAPFLDLILARQKAAKAGAGPADSELAAVCK